MSRYRADLVGARTAEKQRAEKLLEDAQIKLSVVASDIFGVSGRQMLAALIAGERSPKVLAQMARAAMRGKITALEEAFTGFFTSHHAFLLEKVLARVDALDADIAALDAKIEEMIIPFATAAQHLDEIPGINSIAAYAILAETGIDMARFPTAGHLVSWAKFAPGVDLPLPEWGVGSGLSTSPEDEVCDQQDSGGRARLPRPTPFFGPGSGLPVSTCCSMRGRAAMRPTGDSSRPNGARRHTGR